MMIRAAATATILIATVARAGLAQQRWPPDPNTSQVTRYGPVQAPLCTAHTPLLSADSLGPLVPGQTLSDLERRCPSLVYGWDWGDEGIPAPAAFVRLGEVLAEIEFEDTLPASVVHRISTVSVRARTADGFGPGSLLAELVKAWGPAEFGVAECVLYGWFKSRPGLSFRVLVPPAWDCPDLAEFEQSKTPRPFPPDTRVRDVLLVRSDR